MLWLFLSYVLRGVMELFCSICVWAFSLSARCRAASGGALWAVWARGCPLCSGGPQGGAKAPSDPRAQDALPSDWARWPAGGSFLSSGLSELGLLDNGAASRLRGAGLPQCPSREATGGKNEDKEGISCVQLSADPRSISEDSECVCVGELHVQNGGFSVRFLLDDLEDDQWCSSVQVASFPLTVSWEDCPFLFAHSQFDVHELTTYIRLHSCAVYAFLESTCLCLCQFFTVVLPITPWCSLKSERKMHPVVFFFFFFFIKYFIFVM